MKEKRDNTNLLAGSEKEIPGSELDDNQENVESEHDENSSYVFGSVDPKDLGEVIRKCESFRYLI